MVKEANRAMTQYPHLANAPIREALLDIRVERDDSGYVQSPAMGDTAAIIRDAEEWATTESQSLRPVPPPFDMLDERLGREVFERWTVPCEAAFDYLVEQDAVALAKLILSSQLRAADLTFAAEILGHAADVRLATDTLMPLLDHPEAVVREGAIYGLAPHVDQKVRSRLEVNRQLGRKRGRADRGAGSLGRVVSRALVRFARRLANWEEASRPSPLGGRWPST